MSIQKSQYRSPRAGYRFCNSCKKEKSYIDFYRNAKAPDGLQDRCKVCYKKYYMDNQKARNIADREYRKSEKGKETAKRLLLNRQLPARDPAQILAQNLVRRALVAGTISFPGCCGLCGKSLTKETAQFHHYQGYLGNNALKVAFICGNCSIKINKTLFTKEKEATRLKRLAKKQQKDNRKAKKLFAM